MSRRPPRSTRTYTLFPYTTLFRSVVGHHEADPGFHLEAADQPVQAPLQHLDDRTLATAPVHAGHRRQHAVAVQHLAHLGGRSEEHTSELQSLMRISYAVFCLKKHKTITRSHIRHQKRILNTP